MRVSVATAAMLAGLLLLSAAGTLQPQAHSNTGGNEEMKSYNITMLSVISPEFSDNGRIPVKYTADGDDMSPPLIWAGAPADVSGYAIICEDPDAPGGAFTHWVIYNIPGSYNHLDDGVPQLAELDNGAMQGRNSFGNVGYGGPSPPIGKPHHYKFTVYALNAKLDLPTGITKEELLKAMDGYVQVKGTLTGIYGR